MAMKKHSIHADCSRCIQRTITNTLMNSHTLVETRPGAVLHTVLGEMNVPSIGGVRYFATLIDEPYDHVKDV